MYHCIRINLPFQVNLASIDLFNFKAKSNGSQSRGEGILYKVTQ